ncbi:MAG TPA: hypothetical protein VK821_08935 [Dehalococcoidia bacterium]|nr:hypothetical protein [Dehalococcoidia bacterium]
MLRRKRPFGVSVIAVIQILSAATTGVSVVLQHFEVEVVRGEWAGNFVGAVVTALGIVIAVGLWRLMHWAWVWAMIWTGAALAGALMAYVHGQPEYPLMLEGIVTVFYLNQSDVQAAFMAQPPLSAAETSL